MIRKVVVPNPPVLPFPNASGKYFYPISAGSATTNAALGVGTLRLFPWYLPKDISIDRIGAEVTTVGDAGSKLRLGIYADTGSAYPGALILDAGQIAGDSATVQDITVSQFLPAGMYWIGGVVQTVTTTQPTVRTCTGWFAPMTVIHSNSIPGANGQTIGYSQSSVTGALPSTFTATLGAIAAAPRLHIRGV